MAFLHLAARARDEKHRTATTLELMFDLAAVIAIAAAATGLHHGIAAGHWSQVLPGFLMAFFMIWWAWINYTWFASAYDDGSAAFRILSLVTMFGALAIAAGLPAVFAGRPVLLVLFGFVVMRMAMAVLWLGAAKGDPARRATALGHATGIILMQLYWIATVLRVSPSEPTYPVLLMIGVAGELAVPAISERLGNTSWHRHHIMERYALMNVIVLGECFLSIVIMLRADQVGSPAAPVGVLSAVTCAVITFCLWGLYFTSEDHLGDDALRRALLWGYGHFAIFASGAALGAGFAVFHDVATATSDIGAHAASYAVAIPVGTYLAALWVVRDRFCLRGWALAILPGAALLVLAAPLLADLLADRALVPMAAILVVATWLRRFRTVAERAPSRA